MKRSKQPQTAQAESRIIETTPRIGNANADTPRQEACFATTTYWIAGNGDAGRCGESATATAAEMVFTFSSFDELGAVATDWPMRFLVDVWNRLPGQRKVTRFENRSRALSRLWHALQQMPAFAESSENSEPAKANKRNQESAKRKTTLPSKAEQLITLLHHPGGATLTTLMEVSGWQAHTVRGFLSRKVAKQLGLRLQSLRLEGQRVYSVSPVDAWENSDTPKPHKERS